MGPIRRTYTYADHSTREVWAYDIRLKVRHPAAATPQQPKIRQFAGVIGDVATLSRTKARLTYERLF
jgi:hypothetical protein